jgi:hypothetical protein
VLALQKEKLLEAQAQIKALEKDITNEKTTSAQLRAKMKDGAC